MWGGDEMRGVQSVAIYNFARCYQLDQYQSPHQNSQQESKTFHFPKTPFFKSCYSDVITTTNKIYATQDGIIILGGSIKASGSLRL